MFVESLCMGCMEPAKEQVCPQCGWEQGTPPASPLFLAPGTMLGDNYLLGRVLGAGGFGITYLAWDLTLRRKLAIKEYFPNAFGARALDHHTVVPSNTQSKPPFEHGLRKFLEEGQALARFQGHPGIVSVLSFFNGNGTSYLVMAYEEGTTLQQYLKDHGGRIEFRQAMDIAMPVMDALRAVHEAGILHRDISPDNIFINHSNQIKILDFGAAKRDMTSQDRSLQITLKRGYSPEEQYRSNGKHGPWTDVYAMGATLYDAITGTVPPEALDRLDEDTLKPPSTLGVHVPPTFETALMKALAVRAADRFQTIAEFQDALTPAPAPVPTSPTYIPPQPPPMRRRSPRVATALVFISLVVGIAAVSGWWWMHSKATNPPSANQLKSLEPKVAPPAAVTEVPSKLSAPPPTLPHLDKPVEPERVRITHFTIEPTAVKVGQPVTLTWEVVHAKTVRIVGLSEPLIVHPSGTITVVPPLDAQQIVLEAKGADTDNSASAPRDIRILVPPKILEFRSEPNPVPFGDRFTIRWSVTGAEQVRIDRPGLDNLPQQGVTSISTQGNTGYILTYTLAAAGPGGPASMQLTVKVVPQIVDFSAVPAPGRPNSSLLRWTVKGALTVTISPDLGRVKASDYRVVQPCQTTAYTLTAFSPGGPATQELIVPVSPGAKSNCRPL